MVKLFLIIIFLCMLVGCVQKNNVQSINTHLRAAALCNVQLGLGYFQAGQLPRAKQKIIMAIKQAPQIPEVYLAMGYFLLHTNESVLAERYYKRALQLAPHDARVFNNYGVYCYQTGQYRLAMAYFVLAAKTPDYLNSSLAYQNASVCAFKLHDKALAHHYLEQARVVLPSAIMR